MKRIPVKNPKQEFIRETLAFKAFVGTLNWFCDGRLIGILASAKTLYHSLTIADLLEMFGKHAGVAYDLLVTLSEMADRLGIPPSRPLYQSKQKIKSQGELIMANTKEFLEDAQGRLVPVSAIKPIDLKRHEAVTSIMADTFKERDRLIEFKNQSGFVYRTFLRNQQRTAGLKSMAELRAM